MGCGGPKASPWNLGYYGNGLRMTTNTGWNFRLCSSRPGRNGKVRESFAPFFFCFLFLFFPVFFNLREDTQAGSPRHPNGGARNKIRQKSQIFALFFIFNLLHPVKHSIVSKATLGGPSVHCLMSGRPS